MKKPNRFTVKPVGFISSEIKERKAAPLFYTEGAPNAYIDILPEYSEGLYRLKAGDEIIVITWLHLGKRDVLRVHPRGNKANPLTGVFLTRSPDRPNPFGLHRVKVLGRKKRRLHIGPIETINGTPVVDIKPVVESADY